jgi:hypothetical protein
VHGNAPMTPRGRMIMIEPIASGRPVAHVAAEMGVSRKTADKWSWTRIAAAFVRRPTAARFARVNSTIAGRARASGGQSQFASPSSIPS